MSILSYLNPFRLFKDYISIPVESFALQQYSDYKRKTESGLNSARDLFIRVCILLVFINAIIWISVFMYVVFYYTYMPNVAHIRPVHLQFKSCDDKMGMCSYPSAHIQLTKKSQMLMSAQPYRIRLLLEMPESRINKDIGMFMVCLQMRAKQGVLVSSSCRSAMLKYRSLIHQIMRTIVTAPFLLTGCNEEKQLLQIELFSDFADDQALPVTDAYVEVQSRHVQVYWSELQIEAHFTGLRYFMFNWPRLSAFIGILTNLFFVSLIFILSWYHLQDGLPDILKGKLNADMKTEDDDNDDMKPTGKIKLEREDSSQLFDDEHLMEELKDFEPTASKA